MVFSTFVTQRSLCDSHLQSISLQQPCSVQTRVVRVEYVKHDLFYMQFYSYTTIFSAFLGR